MLPIQEYLQDFDNEELSDHDRHEQLREAVGQYNYEHGTDYEPERQIRRYLSWKREINKPDQ